MPASSSPRFLPLTEVAEVLNISVSQVYALVRRGDLPAIKIGGRGQWRVESSQLETYIEDAYKATREFINDHPFVGDEALDAGAETGAGAGAETGAQAAEAEAAEGSDPPPEQPSA